MIDIFAKMIATASRTDRWSPPDHWQEPSRGPVSRHADQTRRRHDLRRALDQTGLR